MRKLLLPCLLALLPVLLLAQDDAPVNRDFYQSAEDARPLIYNDHENIMLVTLNDESFNLVGIDDKMQTLWTTTLQGSAVKAVKVKDKIAVIASTSYSRAKSYNATFKAFLIDPANGKSLAEKTIFNGDDAFVGFPEVVSGSGANVKFIYRKSGFERSQHAVLGDIFGLVSVRKYADEFNQTQELDMITLNDKLDVISNTKLAPPTGIFFSFTANKHDDMFAALVNGYNIDVFKYADGSDKPVKQLSINAGIEIKDPLHISSLITILPSQADNNTVYCGFVYANQEKDAVFELDKLDFSTGKKAVVTEDFDKDHVKELEKAFVPVNKKVNNPDLGQRKGMELRFLAEVDGTLIASLSSRYMVINRDNITAGENSVLINGYDANLGLKFQQILPAGYSMPSHFSSIGYHGTGDKLFVLAIQKRGLNVFEGIYGLLDVKSGQWEKMSVLSKKSVTNYAFPDGLMTCWFANSYIVSYIAYKTFAPRKFEGEAQLNEY